MWARRSFHYSETLITTTLIYGEYQNYVSVVFEGLCELFCRAKCGRPNVVFLGDFNACRVNALHDIILCAL